MEHIIEEAWITEEGYQAVVTLVSSYSPHRCGYVGVPKDNILFGVDYDTMYDLCEDISVHGGLTYSSLTREKPNDDAYPIETQEPLWFFGFDAMHLYDAPDWEAGKKLLENESSTKKREITQFKKVSSQTQDKNATVKTLEFMKKGCNELSKQIKKCSEKKS